MLIRYEPEGPVSQSLLVVCTANVCRSPLAQGLLQRRLGESLRFAQVEVTSAGTDVLPDHAMCELSGEVLGDAEFQAAHVSHALSKQAIQGSDLVITLEREQRGEVARTAPGSQSKVFTLREAVALGEAAGRRVAAGELAPADDLKRLAQMLHATRGTVPITPGRGQREHWWRRRAEPADPLTIEDGHGSPPAAHRARLDEVAAATEAFAMHLATLAGARQSAG
jgi:protein-tyrosine phosphatase